MTAIMQSQKEVKEEKKKRIRLAVDELEVIQAREFISLKQLAIYLGVSRKVFILTCGFMKFHFHNW